MKRLLFVAFAIISLSACIPSYVATGVITTEYVAFEGNVDALVVSCGFDVVLDKSVPEGKVVVTTHKDIMKHLEIYAEDEKLYIGLEGPRKCVTQQLEAHISPDGINSFIASGDSEIYGHFHRDGDISVVASGDSDIELSGRCKGVAVIVSGGSSVDLSELQAEVVVAEASGGSELDVYATSALEIKASGGAEVEYKGTPAILDIKKSGMATINMAD